MLSQIRNFNHYISHVFHTQQIGSDGQHLHSAMHNAGGVQKLKRDEIVDLNALLLGMRGRQSSNPTDKVCALALPCQKRTRFFWVDLTYPIYDAGTSAPEAWERLVVSLTSTRIEESELHLQIGNMRPNNVIQACHNMTTQLLRLFPHPSEQHWFPSWNQVLQYPDVSIRDNDSGLTTEGKKCSLHIRTGRIYRGCSLQLIQAPTSEKKAVYCCTMDGKDVQLLATVPGIEPHIDPGKKYVLVDISPDFSVWLAGDGCEVPGVKRGHEHLPIWQESVIIVCEEVTPTAGTTKHSSKGVKYRLRRVTTLEWDCRLSAEPGPGRWLPFKPSLVHLRSVLCSAGIRGPWGLPYVFCDPEAVTDRLDRGKGWRNSKRCPMYKVFLV